MQQATFDQYKQAFLEINEDTFTDEQIREDARYNEVELID